jgi:hypothetical protein
MQVHPAALKRSFRNARKECLLWVESGRKPFKSRVPCRTWINFKTSQQSYVGYATRDKGDAIVNGPGALMTSYRLYCLDGAGRIGFAEWIEAPNDSDAVEEARRMKRTATRCEVWQGTRLVAALDRADLAATPFMLRDASSGEAGANLTP